MTVADVSKALLPLLILAMVAVSPAATQDQERDEGQYEEEIDPQDIESDLGLIEDMLEAEDEILAGGGYTYDAGGRRDPFLSLLLRTELRTMAEPRPEGVPGLLIDELSIRGIFELNRRMFAQVQTADQTTSYLIQEGDQLYDGEVVSIAPNEVAFRQIVNDPTIIKPFREVVKRLNPEP